jgi:hypothetical protein
MVFLRGSAVVIGAILTLAACQAGEEPNVLGTDGLTMAGAGSVLICHFSGHEVTEEGVVVFSDYATTEAPAPPGSLSICGGQGGNVIEVSTQACINGHGILPEQCLAAE